MKEMKKYLYLILLVCLTASCKHEAKIIEDGHYVIMSLSRGPEGNMKALVEDLPVFDFKGNQMKVSHDFYFGFFEDSIYTYEYKGNVIKLCGENGNHQCIEMRCKYYYDFYLDSDFLKGFSIVREK